MICANCGKEIDNRVVVCIHCGAEAKEKENLNLNYDKKSWITALLLCLFLGLTGAHRFYVGRFSTGMIILILTISIMTFPAACLWVLIDLILILCGKFKTESGKNLVK